MEAERKASVDVCPLEELQRERVKVVSAEGRVIAVFYEEGKLYALDNRCPHMGFPLNRGTVKDGILTCHWHHAKFDLAGGCTFDPFADDVTRFHVEERERTVWLDPRPIEEDRRVHWLGKLDEGLEQNLRLVLAKSVIGLEGLDATRDILTKAALFGIRNRVSGWSSGLSIMTGMANVLPSLDEADRPLALYQGLVHVARTTEGQPPSFDLEALNTDEKRPARYLDWFRRFIEVRAEDAAERTLRTAIRIGLPERAVADMVFAACTDHLFLNEGHSLDFANKAFELLDHIGWEHAEEVLVSLIPDFIQATRMEETSPWRHPVNLPELLGEVYQQLDAAIDEGGGKLNGWAEHQALAEQILDGEPKETLAAMLDAVRQGAPLTELSATVAYAAVRRPVHFRVTNEFADWDTIHHTFTYANGVDQAVRRAPSKLLARGIFDGAMSVYLERFLNVPKQPIPTPSGGTASRGEILASFDEQGKVDEAAQQVADAIAAGNQSEIIGTLGHALLREDAHFHQFQIYEAGLRQYGNFGNTPLGDHVLIGTTRFLAARSPTVRATPQTYDIAARLHRGESLHGED